MKIGAIIQARTSSTRLPEKVLMELPFGSGVSVLEQVIKRTNRCNKIDEIIIATTTDKEDNKIEAIAKQENVACFRGSNEDVLNRYYLAAKSHKLDIIVRITSDCPCMDADIIDLIISRHSVEKADYTSNTLTRTFPHGLDVEIFSFSALERSYKEAVLKFDREHVCPYIYKTNPDSFHILSVEAPKELHAPDIRITLDTEEDYALLCAVFDNCFNEDNFFGSNKIINLFREKSWLKLINKKVIHKKAFDTLREEFDEAIKIIEMHDLKKAKDFIVNNLGSSI